MARIRSIHPDACDSEKLAGLSADAERLFWRLQTHCDDEGRCEDNTRLIWARCMPLVDRWDATKVDRCLMEMAEAGLLIRYSVGGRSYLQVEQWERFQHPQKPKPSELPDPSLADQVPVRDESDTSTGLASSGEEGRGGEAGEGASSALALIETPIPVSTFADFWALYPRKVSKAEAENAWTRATKRTPADAIVEGLRRQLPGFQSKEAEFIPHAATWLNRRRWEDEPDRAAPLGRNTAVLLNLAGEQ